MKIGTRLYPFAVLRIFHCMTSRKKAERKKHIYKVYVCQKKTPEHSRFPVLNGLKLLTYNNLSLV